MFNMNSPIVQSMYANATPEQKQLMNSVGFTNGSAPRFEQGQIETPVQERPNVLSGYSNPYFVPQTNGIPAMNRPVFNNMPYYPRSIGISPQQKAYENNQKIWGIFKEALKDSIAAMKAKDEENFPILKKIREENEAAVIAAEKYKKHKEEQEKKKLHVIVRKGDKILADSDKTRCKSTEWFMFNAHEIMAIERKYYIDMYNRKASSIVRYNNAIERECDNLENFSDICKVMSKVTLKKIQDDFRNEQSLRHIRRFDGNNFKVLFDKFKDKSRLTEKNMSDEEILYRTSNTVKAFDDSQARQFAYDYAFSEENKKYAKLDENGVLTITAPNFNESPPMLLKARLAREADGQNLATKKLQEAKEIFLNNIHEAVLRSKANE